MFISKKDLGDLKSKAGATSILQSQIAKLTEELHALQRQLDFNENLSYLDYWTAHILGRPRSQRTLKTVIKEITDRLDHQEKMQRMLFAHLGIEYAKTTEETATGKQEREVLRRVKRQSK